MGEKRNSFIERLKQGVDNYKREKRLNRARNELVKNGVDEYNSRVENMSTKENARHEYANECYRKMYKYSSGPTVRPSDDEIIHQYESQSQR